MKHISDIKKYERCEKLLWNSVHYPQPFQAFVSYNESIIDLSIQKLKLENYMVGQRNDNNERFFENQATFDSFVNVRFEYHDLRIKANVLVKNKNGYDLYFAYPSCFPKEGEAQSMADTLWVLNHLQIPIKNLYCIHLNADYIRGENLDPDELLVVSDRLFNDRNKQGNLIQSLVRKWYRDLDPILNAIDVTLPQACIEKERSAICTRRNKCMYFEHCFPDNEDTSIYNLVSSSHKFDLYKQGKTTIDQIDFDEIEGTRHQFAQYRAATSKELFFDFLSVECFLKEITYPISYLDFEWETYAFPPYEKMKPYDVLTFQYSLHIENEDGVLEHKEYLGKKDCRIPFIEQLLQDIPKVGTILCFNVEGAEKLRLKQLAAQYPQYADELQAVWERMVDLALPFSLGLIYDTRMAGMYSLKKLVSIFTDYSYDDLEISHGLDAVRSYIDLEDGNDNQDIIDSLLKYCAMDTYAMYLIYHWILKEYKDRI